MHCLAASVMQLACACSGSLKQCIVLLSYDLNHRLSESQKFACSVDTDGQVLDQ